MTTTSAHLVLDEPGQGKVIKQVGEVRPHRSAGILAQTLVVETIHLSINFNVGVLLTVMMSDLGDLSALVVAAQDVHPRRPAHLLLTH